MSLQMLGLAVHTYCVMATSEEELQPAVGSMLKNGWAKGALSVMHTIGGKVYCQVLVSVSAQPAVEGSPRLLLTEYKKEQTNGDSPRPR